MVNDCAMKYESLIFDLDGTLLNTLEDIADAFNAVLKKRGLETYPTDLYRHFVGNGIRELVIRALPPDLRNKKMIEDCVEGFRIEYEKNWKVKTHPYNGVPELLTALAKRSFKISVFSNKPQEFTDACVCQYFPGFEFAVVLGQRDGVPPKPAPDGALEIARKLDVPPAKFIFIGDTSVDMETAIRAGMLPLGVLWGFRTEEELKQSGAAAILSCPEDVLLFIDKEVEK